MKTFTLPEFPELAHWRSVTRSALFLALPPSAVCWIIEGNSQGCLLNLENLEPENDETRFDLPDNSTPCFSTFKVSPQFLELAEKVLSHRDRDKFNVLYRMLWRLTHENPRLLNFQTDDDVIRLKAMAKAVSRDAYKITAYLRFRETQIDGEPYFIAWYEPFHDSLKRVLPFFTERFKNMHWSILTPDLTAHWDGQSLVLKPLADSDKRLFPNEDTVEQYWLTYYASTFNPARLKVNAMLNQMPKKYWKNLPEAKLIQNMIQESPQRVNTFLGVNIL